MYWLLFLLLGALVSVAGKSVWPILFFLFLALLVQPGEGRLHSTVGKAMSGVLVLVLAFLCVCVLLMIGGYQP